MENKAVSQSIETKKSGNPSTREVRVGVQKFKLILSYNTHSRLPWAI